MKDFIRSLLYVFLFVSAIFIVIFFVLAFYNSQDLTCNTTEYNFYKGNVHTNHTLLDAKGDFFLQYYNFNETTTNKLKVCFELEAETQTGIKALIIDNDLSILGRLFIVNGSKDYCAYLDFRDQDCDYLPSFTIDQTVYKYGWNYSSYHWDYNDGPEILPQSDPPVNLFHSYKNESTLYQKFCYDNNIYALGLLIEDIGADDFIYTKSTTSGIKTEQLYFNGSAYTNAKQNPMVINYIFFNNCSGLAKFFLWCYISFIGVIGFILLLIYGFSRTEDYYEDMMQ